MALHFQCICSVGCENFTGIKLNALASGDEDRWRSFESLTPLCFNLILTIFEISVHPNMVQKYVVQNVIEKQEFSVKKLSAPSKAEPLKTGGTKSLPQQPRVQG
jgi:hypothetical protein